MNIEDITKPILIKTGFDRIVIGAYADINGIDAIPLENVMPTKAEICAIIKHHAELLRIVDESFAMGQSGSWEIRQLPYSNSRIAYFEQFVGKEKVNCIIDEVYKGFENNPRQEQSEEDIDEGGE